MDCSKKIEVFILGGKSHLDGLNTVFKGDSIEVHYTRYDSFPDNVEDMQFDVFILDCEWISRKINRPIS